MRPLAIEDHPWDDRAVDETVAVRRRLGSRPDTRDDRAELLAIAAHDLRSPLATAHGFVDLLRERWDEIGDDEKRDYVERVATRLRDLGDLLDDLLDVSRFDDGTTAHDPVPLDLAGLVRDVASGFDETHPDRRITARVPGGTLPVTADRRAVQRVLHNLLTNALAYSPPGSAIEVEASGEDGEALVAVRDQGRGVSPADQRRLFRRFSRVADDGEGAGLGLYISRRLIESGGGRIWVDSERDCGSTFTFALPLA